MEQKRCMRERWPAQLHDFGQEEWAKVPANYCKKLEEEYQKNIILMMQFVGNITKC